MIQLRRANERGHFDHGWLNTFHTFSFADYHDPQHMGFRSLRVINEDRIAPGMGFGMHGHRDMEIITYVLEGHLQHNDGHGHAGTIGPGELQHMSAGTGIRHSEFNPSATAQVHLYQIWIEPERTGLPPSYGQRAFALVGRQLGWQRVASHTGAEGALQINADAELFLAVFGESTEREFKFASGRHGWLQVLRGSVTANEHFLSAGDGLALSNEESLRVRTSQDAEVLLFDLA